MPRKRYGSQMCIRDRPYARDPETLARKWAVPGTKGLEHLIGGCENMNITGTISYVPENHQVMTDLRQEKVARIANYIPQQEVFDTLRETASRAGATSKAVNAIIDTAAVSLSGHGETPGTGTKNIPPIRQQKATSNGTARKQPK